MSVVLAAHPVAALADEHSSCVSAYLHSHPPVLCSCGRLDMLPEQLKIAQSGSAGAGFVADV